MALIPLSLIPIFFCLCLAVLNLNAQTAASWDRIETWPLPPGEQTSDTYRVTVNDVLVPVSRYQADGVTRGIAIAHFTFSGTAKVKVAFSSSVPAGVVLSPKRMGLKMEVAEKSVSFTLDRPQKLALHFGGVKGLDAAEGLKEKLFLFADAFEREVDGKTVVDAVKAGVPNGGGVFVAEKIQALLDALPEGGTLRLGPGTYDLDRRIEMRSHKTVRVEAGALVRFTTVNPGFGKGMFHFDEIEHAALTGRGTLHLNGSKFRNDGAGFSTCQAVRLNDSHHIRIEGLTLRDAGNINVFAIGSDDNRFRDLKIIADADFSNTDGIGLNDGCDRNTAEDLFIYNTDDCVVAGFLEDMSHFTVRHAVMWNHGTGRALKAGTELPGRRYSWFNWENVDVIFAPSVVELRWQNDDGNPVSRDLAFDHIFVKNIHAEAAPTHFFMQLCCGSARNVTFQNMSIPSPQGRAEGNGFRHEEWGGGRVWSRIEDVTIQNFAIAKKVAHNAREAGLEHDSKKQTVRFIATPIPEIEISAARLAVKPGDDAVYIFRRTGEASRELRVAFHVHGSALLGSDYVMKGDSITFAAGSSEARLHIPTKAEAKSGVTILIALESEMSPAWTAGSNFHAQTALHPKAPPQ